MIIVGELINASRKSIRDAIEMRDERHIRKIARQQYEAGANYIDVNAGVFVDTEPACMEWLVRTVQSEVDAPCCIDSPDPETIERALALHKGIPMLNSISLEKDRYNKIMPLITGTKVKIVALCMSDEGMPKSSLERILVADELIGKLTGNEIALDQIFVDPLVQPVATDIYFGKQFLDSVDHIVHRYEGIHIMCGLSNISYGLPNRKLLNRTFAAMAIAKGLDGLIINPLDEQMMEIITSAETLNGKDDYCMNYIKTFREKSGIVLTD